MKILITGATGFIGAKLVARLVEMGHNLVILSRNSEKAKETLGTYHQFFNWDALKGEPPAEAFESVNAIINLMGEGVAERRWTDTQKKKIFETRVLGTKHLVAAAKKYGGSNLKTFISASAIGYYDHHTPSTLTENSPKGQGYMPDLCAAWEHESQGIKDLSHVREVRVRIGVVLGEQGALTKMLPPFKMGVGGPLGDGEQWMNWIHVDDVVSIFCEALHNEKMSGVYNAVSPQNHTNKKFSQILGRVLSRPVLFSVPSPAIRLMMGEMSDIVLNGQKVVPEGLHKLGFVFKLANLWRALEDACRIKKFSHMDDKVSYERLVTRQWVPYPVADIFPFFANAQNLEKITPPWLKFKVLRQSTSTIQKGTQFDYSLKIRGFPISWRSEITHWKKNEKFVDVQLIGPYHLWHHTHRFIPYQGGTIIEDEVCYALPRIPLAKTLAQPLVKSDVKKIFEYRRQVIVEQFYKSEEAA